MSNNKNIRKTLYSVDLETDINNLKEAMSLAIEKTALHENNFENASRTEGQRQCWRNRRMMIILGGVFIVSVLVISLPFIPW